MSYHQWMTRPILINELNELDGYNFLNHNSTYLINVVNKLKFMIRNPFS